MVWMTARAIPWDPIPHEYNQLSDLAVYMLSTPPKDGIVVTVSSFPLGEVDTKYEWRLSFPDYFAYRERGEGYWPDALPLTWPPERGKGWAVDGGMVALWEVVDPQFIRETVSPFSRDTVHHYVLMSHDVAFEIVAHSWRVEDLGLVTE
jgi:hypothetical protein